ncbi:MAG: sulfite exporter TauE/SafE family protein [Proteobacteria bacterium]|nr:sulfite exporter TauE/SafE family protein [Pseudomonadota bacterium]
MTTALVLAGFALGAAASPHCMTMCGAACASLGGGCRRRAGAFHVGRLFGYMAGGAVAAGGVALLGAWSSAAPALRPWWMLLHLAMLALGAWWLVTGRPPGLLARHGTDVPVNFVKRGRPPVAAAVAGVGWVLWPCATLQGGLLLAALAEGPIGGALVMGAFALASTPALAAAPWAWSRLMRIPAAGQRRARIEAFGWRIAGFGVVLASGWALGAGIWQRAWAWCAA